MDLVLRSTPEFRDSFHLGTEVGPGTIMQQSEWEAIPKQNLDESTLHEFDDSVYKIIKYEKADERTPKNFFDLKIFTNLLELQFDPCNQVTRVDVPAIPGAFVLTNVLSA